MNLLNREVQDSILALLHSRFPSTVSPDLVDEVYCLDEKVIANIKYLADLGLVKASFSGEGLGVFLEAIEITGLGLAEAEGFRR